MRDNDAAAVGARVAGRGRWIRDRVDFVRDERCLFCNRPLTSRVARWVVEARIGGGNAGNANGYPAGPRCVKKYAREPVDRLPDFTRAAVEFPAEEHEDPAAGEPADGVPPSGAPAEHAVGDGDQTGGAGLGGARGAKPPRAAAGARELEYLRLRHEKLSGFRLGANDRLAGIYYRTLGSRKPRELSEKDLAYVANLVAKLERQRSTLAPANLQACYAYGFWAELFLREEFHPTVAGILRSLQDNLTLTAKQVSALNAFFANRTGLPVLDPEAFAGVVRKVPAKTSRRP